MAQTNGLQDAVLTWKALLDNDTIAPEGGGCTIEFFSDENGVRIGLEGLILEATDTKIMARLLDASCHDGVSWLDAFSVAALRTLLVPDSLHNIVALALRVDKPVLSAAMPIWTAHG